MTITTVCGIVVIVLGVLFAVQTYLCIRWERRNNIYALKQSDVYISTPVIFLWAQLSIISALTCSWGLFLGGLIFFLAWVVRYEHSTRFAPKVSNVD